ncbi:NAD(+) synthase [Halorubrum trapanicum]|uniref:NAD(+) synthase n=1 Tax=Halorubrum trapanicum TaxID=29284 RepID=UPI000BBAF5AF|nr:NAD(+) synthase [Halorubrum trapanicum]
MADRESAFDSDGAAERSAGAAASDGDRGASRSGLTASLLPDRDLAVERDRVRSFVADRVDAAGADGVVVNMSGGLDSTVTAALAVEALGADRVYGLILPCNKIGAPHARDAEALAEALGIDHDTVHLQPLFAQFGAVAPDRFDLHDEPVRSGNAVARLRMTVAYLAANATNRLVCGTANRSELLLGYLTKHGDGAADLFPLGHLYKTDVRTLATELDVPEFVVEKPPTAGFLPGQRDADDLGAPYEVVDPVLHLGVDRGLDPAAVVERIGGPDDFDVDRELVTDLLGRHRATAHKRLPPPTPDADVE